MAWFMLQSSGEHGKQPCTVRRLGLATDSKNIVTNKVLCHIRKVELSQLRNVNPLAICSIVLLLHNAHMLLPAPLIKATKYKCGHPSWRHSISSHLHGTLISKLNTLMAYLLLVMCMHLVLYAILSHDIMQCVLWNISVLMSHYSVFRWSVLQYPSYRILATGSSRMQYVLVRLSLPPFPPPPSPLLWG